MKNIESNTQVQTVFNQEIQTPSTSNNDGHMVVSGEQYYTIAGAGEVTQAFRVVLRCGTKHIIPYALLPVITLRPSGKLIITAYELLIIVEGRCLDKIEEYFFTNRITSLTESSSGKDHGNQDVFISHIKASGHTLNPEGEQ